jgi:WD40 repeat protein
MGEAFMGSANSAVTSKGLPASVLRVLGDLRLRTDGTILDLACSADGTLYAVEAPGTLRRWKADGTELGTPTSLSEVELLWVLSPDGRWLASASEELQVFESSRCQLVLHRRQPSWITALAFDTRGSLLATGHEDGQISVWDLSARRLSRSWPGHDSAISALAFSPDGTRLISAAEDRTVLVWDAGSAQVRQRLEGHTDRVQGIAWHPDNRIVAIAGWDTMARIWDAETGQPVVFLNGHAEVVTAAIFSPDGRRLVTADSDHVLWVWDFACAKVIHKLRGHRGEITSLAFTPGGSLVSGGADRRLLLWDIEQGRALEGSAEPLGDLARIASGKGGRLLAYINGGPRLRLWDAQAGRIVGEYEGRCGLTAVAYSETAGLLAVGDEQGCIHLFPEGASLPDRSFAAHKTGVTALAFRDDGEVLASAGGTDGYVYLWRLRDLEPILLIPEATDKGSVETIAWVPRSPCLVAGGLNWLAQQFGTGHICVWDVAAPKKVRSLAGTAIRFCVRPDGQQLAVADGTEVVCLWDLHTGELTRELDLRTSRAAAVAYAPHGRQLAACSRDGLVVIWDLPAGSLRKTLDLGLSLDDLAWASDGSLLFLANAGGLCYVVEA